MKKTSIYLSERDDARLAELSKREGRSRAEIIRAAIAAYESVQAPHRKFAMSGCVEGDGTSAADVPEEEYLKGFGEDGFGR